MAKKKEILITVAVGQDSVVVGTANSIVLDRIGASARKLGVAKKKGGVPVVRSKDGLLWDIYEDQILLKVKRGGFKIIT